MPLAEQRKPLDAHTLRQDFPILETVLPGGRPLIYLDSAASTQRPRQVIEAMAKVYEESYANVHRGIHTLSERCTELYEEAREKVRVFINARAPEEVIFTAGTTAGVNTVARSWGDANVKAGDEIILSLLEHHSNIVPWQQLAARTGCVLRYIPITDDGRLLMDEYEKLLNAKTRLVAITAVSNVLGTVTPLPEIIQKAHAVGAKVLVDAAQMTPHLRTDVQALDADFLVFSGHKMLGPTGVGILYGKQELLDAMPAFLGGGSMINTVELDHFTPADLPAKFEAGTPPIVEAIGLGAAIDYLNTVGVDAIHEHELFLTRHAHDALDGVAGVEILGPTLEHKAGIVTFKIAGVHPHDAAHVLDRFGVAVRAGHHCAQPLHARLGLTATTRASFYLYNTLDEIDQLADALVETQKKFRRKS